MRWGHMRWGQMGTDKLLIEFSTLDILIDQLVVLDHGQMEGAVMIDLRRGSGFEQRFPIGGKQAGGTRFVA